MLITLLSSCQELVFFKHLYTTLYKQPMYTFYEHRIDCNSNLIYYYVQISIAGPLYSHTLMTCRHDITEIQTNLLLILAQEG